MSLKLTSPTVERKSAAYRADDMRVVSNANSSAADRLAAAGRLRSAVALELAAGKVWALPIAVQPARGTHRRNGTGSP
jgi:hypothetical protein